MKTVIAYIMATGLVAVSALVYALVMARLWHWFMVPLRLPELSTAHAYGVGMVVSFMSPMPVGPNEDEANKYLLHAMVLRPLFALAAGYVAHRLMVNP